MDPVVRRSVLLLLWLGAARVQATETLYPSASLAMPLNARGIGARAMALGAAYTSVAEDETALFWNPGGLAYLDHLILGIHQESGFGGLTQQVGLLEFPISKGEVWSASLNAVDDGNFEGRDDLGTPTGNYTAGTLGASLGWGHAWTSKLGLGLSTRYSRQNLADASYQAFAATVGFLWKPRPYLWWGAAATNFGLMADGSSQAASVNVGASLHLPVKKADRLMLAFELKDGLGGAQQLDLGVEYLIMGTLAMRGGYRQDLAEPDPAGSSGLSAGLGLAVSGFSLDYAFVPFGPLGSTQAISLCYHFGAEEPRPAKPPLKTLKLIQAKMSAYRERVLKDPSDAPAWWAMGDLFVKAVEPAKADYCYKKALRLRPDDKALAEGYRKFKQKHPELK